MPTIVAEGCPLHVEIDGEVEGEPGRPVLMLSNSLGTDLHMWDGQVAAFTKRFRLVRYDQRGHGRSGAPPGPYTMERLGRDALAVMDALGLARVHWCGLSMGGMTGIWLAAAAPARIERLVLSNTTSYYADKMLWGARIEAVRAAGGPGPLADRLLALWFTTDFRAREPATIERMRAMLMASPVEGYIGCCEAIRDMDHRPLLGKISNPTLIIAGRHDQATPVAAAEFIREHIASATLTVLEAAHISNIEQREAHTEAVLTFLAGRAG
jgi:3-oxoadipate enol-lactonase